MIDCQWLPITSNDWTFIDYPVQALSLLSELAMAWFRRRKSWRMWSHVGCPHCSCCCCSRHKLTHVAVVVVVVVGVDLVVEWREPNWFGLCWSCYCCCWLYRLSVCCCCCYSGEMFVCCGGMHVVWVVPGVVVAAASQLPVEVLHFL